MFSADKETWIYGTNWTSNFYSSQCKWLVYYWIGKFAFDVCQGPKGKRRWSVCLDILNHISMITFAEPHALC